MPRFLSWKDTAVTRRLPWVLAEFLIMPHWLPFMFFHGNGYGRQYTGRKRLLLHHNEVGVREVEIIVEVSKANGFTRPAPIGIVEQH